ncbi:hypothetical protein V8E55_010422 [Tylopilus felleus]
MPTVIIVPSQRRTLSHAMQPATHGPIVLLTLRSITSNLDVPTILLWDQVLTFPDEVQLIWNARLSIAKVLFLLNRYMVPFAMIAQSHEFSGTTPHLSLPVSRFRARCPGVSGVDVLVLLDVGFSSWYTIGMTVGMLSIASNNFLILLRLWVLWDRSPRLVLGTLTFFVVTQLVTFGCAAYVIYDMLPSLLIDPVLRVCLPTSKPKLMLLWTPGIVFEFIVFLTTVWNALDRPRSRNIGMTHVLYRDGSLYFFGLFALRLVNMLVCVLAPASLTFLGVFFLWSVCNITVSRLIFNLRRLSSEAAANPNTRDEDEEEKLEDVEEGGGTEQTELPVLHKERDRRERHDFRGSTLASGLDTRIDEVLA